MGGGRMSGNQPAGIYGWRKQCLYAVILFLLIVVIMNLAVTIWILRVLNFHIEGLNMGSITISSAGITVGGRTEVVKTLYATNISAGQNGRLNVISDKSLTIKSYNNREENDQTNNIHIGKNKILSNCDSFEIRDLSGNSRLKVTDKGITYGMDDVTYSGKAVFNGSIETPNIRGPYKGSLKLESASSSILVSGRDRVFIDAAVGNIEMKSSGNIAFNANKEIILNSTHILIPKIPEGQPSVNGQQYHDVYQLCLCQNGRLFLAPSTGKCVTEKNTCS